jgi:DnaJ homolog subfamily C member 8
MSSVDDIDKLLNREASAFQREVEVERILKAFKLNPYDVLDLDGKASPEDIKKKYRQISLCKHLPEPALPCAEVVVVSMCIAP